MGGIELAIFELSLQDVSAALALSREAQWNQIEDDWLLFLTQGHVFGARDCSGMPIATAALLPFGDENAWISMVLVTAQWRRKGLATRLVQACLNAAAEKGLIAWLDATDDGAAVYGRMGFSTQAKLHRMRFAGGRFAAIDAGLSADQIQNLMAHDRETMRFDRRDLLRALSLRSGSDTFKRDSAMSLVRNGRVARHIGPLFADDTASALDMVESIVGVDPRPHMLDAAAANEPFVKGLIARGWSHERSFLRMRFGHDVAKPVKMPFAIAGPEYG